MILCDLPVTSPEEVCIEYVYDDFCENKQHALANYQSEYIPLQKQLLTLPYGVQQIKAQLEVDNRVLLILDSTSTKKHYADVEVADITGKLDEIKTNLSLSVTQLADFIGVTRKTIYDWHDGVAPRASNYSRIETIISVIESFSQKVDLKKLKNVWNIPFNGKSFRDIYKDEKLSYQELYSELTEKLHEISPRLVKKTNRWDKEDRTFNREKLSRIGKHADFT